MASGRVARASPSLPSPSMAAATTGSIPSTSARSNGPKASSDCRSPSPRSATQWSASGSSSSTSRMTASLRGSPDAISRSSAALAVWSALSPRLAGLVTCFNVFRAARRSRARSVCGRADSSPVVRGVSAAAVWIAACSCVRADSRSRRSSVAVLRTSAAVSAPGSRTDSPQVGHLTRFPASDFGPRTSRPQWRQRTRVRSSSAALFGSGRGGSAGAPSPMRVIALRAGGRGVSDSICVSVSEATWIRAGPAGVCA